MLARFSLLLLMLVSPFVQAFDFSQLQEMANDPEAMQQMAKEAAEASECANAAGLEKMRAEGAAMHEKIRALCAGGDRNGAERVAIDYSKKFMNSTEYRQIKKCSEKMLSYLPAGYREEAQAKAAAADSTGEEVKHVCDAMQP